jgi:hypothetical protein
LVTVEAPNTEKLPAVPNPTVEPAAWAGEGVDRRPASSRVHVSAAAQTTAFQRVMPGPSAALVRIVLLNIMVFPQVDCPRGVSRRRLIVINTFVSEHALPPSSLLADTPTVPGMLAPTLVCERWAIALGALKRSPDTRIPPADNYWVFA